VSTSADPQASELIDSFRAAWEASAGMSFAERLTRQSLRAVAAEIPALADLVIELDTERPLAAAG